MSAELLLGKPIANEINKDLKKRLETLKKEYGIVPSLASILVEGDSASRAYAKRQQKSATKLGIDYRLHELSDDISEKDLTAFIQELNTDDSVNGIIVQMPLPEHIDRTQIQSSISQKKDVEGVTPGNIGLIVLERPRLVPCTAMAVAKLIDSTGVDVYGKELTMVGCSAIVGKPVALLMLREECFATTTVCHIGTAEKGDLPKHVSNADILVVAVGKPEVVKGEWVKEGAIVIDVGFNMVDGKITGDVEFEVAKERASFITPVPGGVGPLTVAGLFENTVKATEWQQE